LLLSGCGSGLGYEPATPHATKEQIVGLLSLCQIDNAKVRRGMIDGETDWVIDFEVVEKSKLDCLDKQQEKAGTLATTLALSVEQNR
jgi:hypothetical protein